VQSSMSDLSITSSLLVLVRCFPRRSHYFI
jgi:hypothetical protein